MGGQLGRFVWPAAIFRIGAEFMCAAIAKPELRQAQRMVLVLLVQVVCSLLNAASAQSRLTATTIQNISTDVGAIRSPEIPAYPLKVSANNRYLVDQNDVPFLMVGDSPQALVGNLSPTEAAFFMNNRRRYGVNTLWVNLLCNDGTACNADGTTSDGIAPFTTVDDLSTPNPAYFERADGIINFAAVEGMVVILDPIETIGWLRTLRANGLNKAFAFGPLSWKSLPEFSEYHLDAQQRLSDMAKRDRRRTGPGSCARDQKCGFKPYPYSGTQLLHEWFFGGSIMGIAYRTKCGIHLLCNVCAGSH